MALIDSVKAILGSAWHVASDPFFAALLPAADGTVEAGKVLVPDSNKRLDTLDFASGGLKINGTAVTATAAQANFLSGVTAGTPLASKALVLDSALGIGAFRQTGRNLRTQATPAAKTTTTTLTAAEIMAGLITANQGAAGAATYTMPLGTDLETALIAAFPGLANDDSFDVTIVNISTNAAEDVTVAGNTGTTAVGNMTIASNAAVTDQAWGTFRFRRTSANNYSFYRIG